MAIEQIQFNGSHVDGQTFETQFADVYGYLAHASHDGVEELDTALSKAGEVYGVEVAGKAMAAIIANSFEMEAK
jgi:hypothetical protein